MHPHADQPTIRTVLNSLSPHLVRSLSVVFLLSLTACEVERAEAPVDLIPAPELRSAEHIAESLGQPNLRPPAEPLDSIQPTEEVPAPVPQRLDLSAGNAAAEVEEVNMAESQPKAAPRMRRRRQVGPPDREPFDDWGPVEDL